MMHTALILYLLYALPCYCIVTQRIHVYDQVVPSNLRLVVDQESVKRGQIAHTLFDRQQPPCSAVEFTIDTILQQLNDKSPYAEYWWRDEWMSLEMHRDLDEKLARDNGPSRCPNHGHVLYLQIGSEVNGPTLVLQDSEPVGSFDLLTIVPAVEGRLLRFSGDMMHTVPRPALAYLDPSDGGSNVEQWTRIRPNPLDPADRESTVCRRSVLLFNTWNEKPFEVPPRGQDEASVYLDAIDSIAVASSHDIPVFGQEEELIRLKIGLLGTARRRERADKYVNLYAARAIKSALEQIGGPPLTFPVKEL